MKPEFVIHQSYGRNRFYPSNDDAKLLCKLAKLTCMEDKHLGILRKLGVAVNVVLPASLVKIARGGE